MAREESRGQMGTYISGQAVHRAHHLFVSICYNLTMQAQHKCWHTQDTGQKEPLHTWTVELLLPAVDLLHKLAMLFPKRAPLMTGLRGASSYLMTPLPNPRIL